MNIRPEFNTLLYVSDKAIDKFFKYFVEKHYWFQYTYNRIEKRHEVFIPQAIDPIKDIPSKLGKFITSAEGK